MSFFCVTALRMVFTHIQCQVGVCRMQGVAGVS